jgi:hypothetical protein
VRSGGSRECAKVGAKEKCPESPFFVYKPSFYLTDSVRETARYFCAGAKSLSVFVRAQSLYFTPFCPEAGQKGNRKNVDVRALTSSDMTDRSNTAFSTFM